MKGFRPGKEPPQLRKQRAKQQFGEVSATQERLIEMFAERTPAEARGLIRRWRMALLAGAIILAACGAVVFTWSLVASVVFLVLAAVVLFFWWRLHRQRQAFEAMADAVSGPPRGKRKR
jgi:Flp pilus assembly protein TadB